MSNLNTNIFIQSFVLSTWSVLNPYPLSTYEGPQRERGHFSIVPKKVI